MYILPSESYKVVENKAKVISFDAVCVPMAAEPSVVDIAIYQNLLDFVQKFLG